MSRILFLIILLLTSSCASIEHNTLVSPSEATYEKANTLYENQEYFDAIPLYAKFLEDAPRSRFAIPARLNLGMSYYYLESYKMAYETLKDQKIEDENIKAYVDTILKICLDKAGDEIQADETKLLASAGQAAGNGEIKITVLEAFANDFGEVVLKGTVSQTSSVFIDSKKIALDATNGFTAAVSWRRGRPILIEAEDTDGGSGALDYFPDTENPDEPIGLRVLTASANSIEVEWEENTEEDIKGYRLYYRLKGGSPKEVRDIIKRTRYEVVGLQSLVSGSNRTFEFYVRAVDLMNNESSDSDIVEAILP